MTAVIGILNKQAVAIAADSAVTVDGANGRKIFNKANKVFTLSKYHPIGVMIYNSASFMHTPWETIIKIYRKQLGDTSFATLKEYLENFISFLRGKQFYSNGDEQKSFLFSFINELINGLINNSLEGRRDLIENPTDENKQEILLIIEQEVDLYIQKFTNEENYCNDFSDYSFDEFRAFGSIPFTEALKQAFNDNGYIIGEPFRDKLEQLVYVYLKTKETFTNFTGLIFTGFGEDEIYPSLIPVNISLAINTRLRFYIEETKVAVITNDNSGAVCPFAQTDVIDTILTGIDPKLDDIYMENLASYFSKYNEAILDIIGDGNPELTAQIRELDIQRVVDSYREQNWETRRVNNILPLMDAVSNLSKEDLVEMAESLIYLTYLKRRITFAEESVGGPVDVAVISKGDGFIWIKRKHYFKPELNQYFFDNYFNK